MDNTIEDLYLDSNSHKSIIFSSGLSDANLSVIVFSDNDGNEVGKLDFSSGTVKFYGDTDESAKIFFDKVLRESLKYMLRK